MGVLADFSRCERDRLMGEGRLRSEGRLLIFREDCNLGRVHVKIWRGKAAKPYANYLFNTAERADAWIAREIDSDVSALKAKEDLKAKEAAAKKEMADRLKVGSLLRYSWGWEQTNVDFFEVVSKKGMSVEIRPICGEIVPGSEYPHGMACKMRPCPGAFIEGKRPIKKRITAYGLSMVHGVASLCEEGDEFYCSWYA